MKFKAPIEVESSLVDSSNSSGSAGQVLTSTGVGVDWINPTLLPAESAEKVIQTVRFGEAVSKGDPLVVTGYHGSNGPAIVERADATDATKMPAYGVALEDYANNATGLMIAVGDFNDFDTSAYSVGDTLYVAVGGGMTNVKPTGTALIQNIGIVSRSNANNGDVEIVAIGRTNDVPNLPTGRLFVGTATNTSLISDVVYVDDANGRMGIGTTNPSRLLTLEGASTPTIQITDTTTPVTLSISAANSRANVGTETSHPLRFLTNDTEKMRITSDGNVGIGTTSPSEKLEVAGGSILLDNFYKLAFGSINTSQIYGHETQGLNFVTNGSSRLKIEQGGNVGIGTDTPSHKLTINASNDTTALGIDFPSAHFDFSANSTSGYTSNFRINDVGMDIGHDSTARSLNLQTGNQDRLTILGNGNVGIGTTSPARELEVTGTGNVYIRVTAPTSTDSSAIELVNTAETWTIRNQDTNDNALEFSSDGGTKVTMVRTGSVGIGTTSPQEKLDISAGSIRLDDNQSITWASVDANVGRVRITGNEVNDYLTFVTDNSEKMRLTNTGLGIGTSSPSQKLEVAGVIPKIYLNSSNNTGGSILFDDNLSTGTEIQGTQGNVIFKQSGYEKMRITSTGNVGIGTTSPDSLLEIASDSVTDFLKLTSTGGGSTPVKLIFEKSTSEQGIIEYNRNGDLEIYNTDADGGVMIDGSASGGADLYVANTGNVGIGTTSPSTKLHISDATTPEVRIQDTTNNRYLSLYQNNSNSYIQSSLNSPLVFSTHGSNERMRITTSGNVGIGTTSPDYALHVDPTVKIGDRQGTDGSLILQSQQGPNITLTSTGDNLNISGTTGSSNGNTIRLADNIKLFEFNANIGGTIKIRRGNRGLMDTNFGGFVVEQQTTTSSNGKSTFLSTDSNGTILRSTSYGGAGTSGDIQFQFGGGDNTSEPAPATKMIIKNTGNVGIGTTSPGSKLEVQGGDIEVNDSASGLILKSPDGTRYRITVANGGTLTVTAV